VELLRLADTRNHKTGPLKSLLNRFRENLCVGELGGELTGYAVFDFFRY
jgi:hypothetical protein